MVWYLLGKPAQRLAHGATPLVLICDLILATVGIILILKFRRWALLAACGGVCHAPRERGSSPGHLRIPSVVVGRTGRFVLGKDMIRPVVAKAIT